MYSPSLEYSAARSFETEGAGESSQERLKELLDELIAEGDEDVYYKSAEQLDEGQYIAALTTLEQIVAGWSESDRKSFIETRIADLKEAFGIEE